MKRYSDADLIAFEQVADLYDHGDGDIIRELVAYIRASVGVEPMPPMPQGEPPTGLDRRLWRWGVPTWKAAEYYDWEGRYADYWARRAGGGV